MQPHCAMHGYCLKYTKVYGYNHEQYLEIVCYLDHKYGIYLVRNSLPPWEWKMLKVIYRLNVQTFSSEIR